jgi:hypothetical protein
MSSLPEVAVPLALAVLSALAVFVVIRTIASRRLRCLEVVFDPGSVRRRGWLLPHLEGTVRGVRVRYLLEPRSNHSPGAAEVRCIVVAPVRWQLQRRGLHHRLLESVGLVRPRPTGAADLDQRFLLTAEEGREPPLAAMRTELDPLIDSADFARLTADRRGLTARWSPRNPADHDAAEVSSRVAAVLRVVDVLGYPPKM